jgi:hypothetical protein
LFAVVEIEQEIPAEFFVAVAQIIAEVFRARAKRKKRLATAAPANALPLYPQVGLEHMNAVAPSPASPPDALPAAYPEQAQPR